LKRTKLVLFDVCTVLVSTTMGTGSVGNSFGGDSTCINGGGGGGKGGSVTVCVEFSTGALGVGGIAEVRLKTSGDSL
jgi:hypothetical protein